MNLNASKIACILLQAPIVRLIEHGKWHRILLQTWCHNTFRYADTHASRTLVVEGPIKDWTPQSANTWTKSGLNHCLKEAKYEMTTDACRMMAQNIVSIADRLRDHNPDGGADPERVAYNFTAMVFDSLKTKSIGLHVCGHFVAIFAQGLCSA